MSAQPDPNNPGYDMNGDPLVKGVVGGEIQPISFKDLKTPNQGKVVAEARALDADGNVLDQSEQLKK